MNKTLNFLALTLLIVGGLVWGLIGFFNFNLVHFLFGSWVWLERIIYGLVGLSAIYCLMLFPYITRED